MAKQAVFVVGGVDSLLNKMWSSHPDYRVTSDMKQADILCFQGGDDIHPCLYDQVPLPKTYFNKDTDRIDLDAYEKAGNRPKVGICRGGQFLNVLSEGSMFQHVNNHNSSHKMKNLLNIPKSSFGVGAEIEVTSVHHQMMIPNHHYGEVLGIAKVSTVFENADPKQEKPEYDTEIVFYNKTQSLCYQPHPEYDFKIMTRTYFFKLMEFFFR